VVGEANWLVDDAPGEWTQAWVQHRYNSAPVRGEVRVAGEMAADQESPSGRRGVFEVRFEEAQRAVAPGQALVVYDGAEPDVVLGGGWIGSAAR
jgi:tRNA U34 2-thiouridine synthase MnmA/TrmU